jgi:NAD(P)-dependent dehydrogenase (short-subunit alcohol dehydrogenase family)
MLESSVVLNRQVALVTGGGQGIGRALCLALAKAGADVAVADILLEPAQQVAAEIEALGRRASAIQTDVSQADSVREMIAACVDKLGGLNILVNNAGIFPVAPLPLISEADWDRVMAVNLKGVFLCCQAALTPLRQSGDGRVINIASVSGLVGAIGLSHYAASKAGVVGFTKSLAREVAPFGITANAVAPGIFETGQVLQNFPEAALRVYKSQVPLGRLGQPDDLTELVVFLASPGAAYITGQVYSVNGGYTMQ